MGGACYVEPVNAADRDTLAAAQARLDRALARLTAADRNYRTGVTAIRGRYGRGIVTAIARHLDVHRVTIAKLVGSTPNGPGGAELTDVDKATLTTLYRQYCEADKEVNGDDGAYANRAAVLRELHGGGRAGVAELARELGMGETTVSDIVNAAHRGGGRSRTARRPA